MNQAYEFKAGSVTKYSVKKRKHIKKFHVFHFAYISIFIISLITTFWVFKLCIKTDAMLSDTIALGSIFATFGSSIVAIFSLVLSRYYDRFKENISILFSDSLLSNAWYRWPFIKRESHHTLYNKELTYQALKNATISFNVGSHNCELSIPTIKEDFYDLENWTALFNMFSRMKDYESFVLNNVIDPANSLMIWDCMLDNYKSIAIYKISKLFIVLGESYIFSSIILAFTYLIIPF